MWVTKTGLEHRLADEDGDDDNPFYEIQGSPIKWSELSSMLVVDNDHHRFVCLPLRGIDACSRLPSCGSRKRPSVRRVFRDRSCSQPRRAVSRCLQIVTCHIQPRLRPGEALVGGAIP